MFTILRHRTSVKILSPQKVFFVLPGENRQFCYQFYCFVVFPFNYSTQRKLDFVFTFNYGWLALVRGMHPNKRKCKGKIGRTITVDCRQQFVQNAANFRAVDAYTREL